MLAAVELAMLVDGVAHQVERRIASALRADDGAMLAIQFDTSCHIFMSLPLYIIYIMNSEPCPALGRGS